MKYPLGAGWVRDQLALRVSPANVRRVQPDGEFVLYWMQATQRLDENWALRFAILEADRLGRPLLIHHEPLPSAPYACDRFLLFELQGAREIAREAARRGLPYQLVLPRALGAPEAVVALAERALLVVTDRFPTAGVAERTARVAESAPCRVVAVDSAGIVPAASFPREEYAARTIRPKLAKLLDFSLAEVEEQPPARELPASTWDSLDVERLPVASLDDDALRAEVARCDVDHDVAPVACAGGVIAARARLDAFLHDGLAGYAERRRHPDDEEGSSRLSPWLHHGQIAPAEVARAVRAHGPAGEAAAFLDEMVTWRELALNCCTRNPRFASLAALPDWVHQTMRRHAGDRREPRYTLRQLERGETHDALWNAGQRELRATGRMHNVVRMLWGKSVLTWAPTYGDALRWLVHLNDRWALDGRDPSSYAGILWCFGKFDRPFAERPVWGTIRPMSLERARVKYDVKGYIARWS
ncbi:MAG TPA: deoxyribodipyrimidine photo-lyase [Gemmatimonadaceae bacterium]